MPSLLAIGFALTIAVVSSQLPISWPTRGGRQEQATVPLYTVDIPPAIYDHPFLGKVVVHNHLLSEMPKYCDRWQTSCAPIGVHAGGTCDIYILTPSEDNLTPAFYELIKRHEEAHCSGWPADHPGARGTEVEDWDYDFHQPTIRYQSR